ncbi:hypothetical protein FFF34_012705 [Inquilinus sp. KBS0705]|nr:hypothetical protein FFF34_012705 [Inquilinus sp. KBS0705]
MKKLLSSTGLIMCLLIMGCSKKNNLSPVNTKHTIKITATSEKEIVVDLAVIKSGETDKKYVNTQTITGSYEYSLDLNVGDKLWVEVLNNNFGNVLFTFYDNGKAYGVPVTSSAPRISIPIDVK